MTLDEMTVGLRVRLINHIGGNYPGAPYSIEPGPQGSIIARPDKPPDDDGSHHVAEIRFDEPIEDLRDWDNVLHVWSVEDHGDCSPEDFEQIGF